MSKLLCPKCHQPSFSDNIVDFWVCPICNNENTNSLEIVTSNQTKPQLFIIKKDYLEQTPELNTKIKPYVFQSFD
ncbi:hypothetical protein J1P26_00935 [Neobacillus sp. MM2021_6]|uniref:hypothetical protein n=1 Tax=Bacillaceae TaxID=186817 RepID=UPI0014092874|nr:MULTISPECIES: hypothetical protein [Bacillaceae]MBO0958282.1 hypothetical protein [Neobacillus sp. MM2021_6]NHC17882.1 hypothetical protein [Bacillus sp. MM2020_4]